MKRVKNLAIIILMITTLIILSTSVKATTGVVNSETIRLRKKPDSESITLDLLEQDDEVEIIEELEDWLKVTAIIDGEKITGYVDKKLVDYQKEENVSTQAPVEQQVPVAEIEESKEYNLNQNISVKCLPLMNSIEKAIINSGNIKVVEILNEWCKIENETESGWFRINTLKSMLTITTTSTEVQQTPVQEPQQEVETPKTETEPAPETKPEITTSDEKVIKTAYVSADGLRVRKEANTTSEVIDSLSRNDKISILEELDGWYKIKVNDQIGYVSSKYVSDTKVPETTSRSGSTLKKEESVQVEENKTVEPEIIENTSSATGTAVVEYAKQFLGYKYKSGGASPDTGFDCSGFTAYVYKHFGISLNRSSADQMV